MDVHVRAVIADVFNADCDKFHGAQPGTQAKRDECKTGRAMVLRPARNM